MNDHRSPETTSTTEFEARARQLYRHAASDLDTHMAARLRAARRDALQGDTTARHRQRWMMPAGAVAAGVLAVAVFWQPLRTAQTPPPHGATASVAHSTNNDLPPDPGDTDPGMEQNLDFYAWLADQPAPQRAR